MKPEPDVDRDELLSALEELLRPKADEAAGLTFDELYARAGVSRDVIRRCLKRLRAENRLEVTRVSRIAIDGTYRPVPAYRLKSLPPDGS